MTGLVFRIRLGEQTLVLTAGQLADLRDQIAWLLPSAEMQPASAASPEMATAWTPFPEGPRMPWPPDGGAS